MPTYIALIKLTDQGIREIKNIIAEQQRGEGRAALERSGARITGFWWTQGAYDAVLVGESQDDESASVAALTAGMRGQVRGETMRAYTAEEMQRIVQKLP